MHEICDNDFFDSRYMSRELPDDFFEMAAGHFSEDPIIKYANTNVIVNGVEGSNFHYIDYDSNVIMLGPKDVCDPLYYIEHDEEVVEPVLAWYENFCNGSNAIFPDVAIAQPIVPPNKLEKIKDFTIQRYMMERGYVLCNPSYSEVKHLSFLGDMASDHPYTSDELDFSSLSPTRKRFYPYVNYISDEAQIVTMQFNPYHPMSLSWIKSFEKIGEYRAIGEYVQDGRVYTFDYDFYDTRYRVHSDQWMTLVGTDNCVYERFDLVGNFDFLQDFSYIDTVTKVYHDLYDGYKERENTIKRGIIARTSIIQPFFVEPFDTEREPYPGYSVIGPWQGKLIPGVRDSFYSPYMTPRLDVVIEGDKYRDVTDKCVLTDSELIVGDEHFDLSNTYQYYIKRYGNATRRHGSRPKDTVPFSGFQVFVRDVNGDQNFIKVPYRVYSYPYNGQSSIIYPMRFASMISVLSMDKYTTMKEFLPLAVLTKKHIFDPHKTLTRASDHEIVSADEVIDSISTRTRCRFSIDAVVSDDQFYEFISYCEGRLMSGFVKKDKLHLTGEIEMCSRADFNRYEHFILHELRAVNCFADRGRIDVMC